MHSLMVNFEGCRLRLQHTCAATLFPRAAGKKGRGGGGDAMDTGEPGGRSGGGKLGIKGGGGM